MFKDNRFKRLDSILLAVLAASIVLVILFLLPSSAAGQISNNGITMLAPSVDISPAIQEHALNVLAPTAPERGVFTYAITSIDQAGDYWLISVAGFPYGQRAKWSINDAIWLGTITMAKQNPSGGLIEDSSQPGQPAKPEQPHHGTGGAGDILPFASGTQAQYGMLGVHNCGFSMGGWQAVDLFPADGTIYAAQSGEVSYVCRDNTQISYRIGEHMYVHMADTGIAVGTKVNQGDKLGAVVKGTFNDTCGNADQQPEHGHVHFCFVPYDNIYTADGYTLNTLSGAWVKGEETIEPLGYLTASWESAGLPPPSSAVGNNFFDGLAMGYMGLVNAAADKLPVHNDFGLADRIINIASIPLHLVYSVILVNFNMKVAMWVFGIIFALEMVRILYSAWLWVKRAIPIIG